MQAIEYEFEFEEALVRTTKAFSWWCSFSCIGDVALATFVHEAAPPLTSPKDYQQIDYRHLRNSA